MAVYKYSWPTATLGVAYTSYFVCDLESELPDPATVQAGDQAFTKDTKKLWIAIDSSTWKQIPFAT